MKFLNHELGKTCFYNLQTDTGVILHSPIPTYKQLWTKQMHPEEYTPIPEPSSSYSVNLDNIDQTKAVINELLKKYVDRYVRCPACDSANTMNPITDAQQEEENMSFGISCKDCEQTTEMSVDEDPFLLAISASRIRNNSVQHHHQRGPRRDRYNGYAQGYYRNAGQYFYGYPAQYYNGAYYAAPYGYYPYAAQQYYYEQQPDQFYYLQGAYGYNYNVPPTSFDEQSYNNTENENTSPNENIANDDKSSDEPQYKSAGVLPFCHDASSGRILFLLGKEVRGSNPNRPVADTTGGKKTRPTWSEFGGKKNRQDSDAIATAARELSEETFGVFSDDSQYSVERSIQVVDAMLRVENILTVYNKNGKYQLYLLQVPYVKKEKLLEARKKCGKTDSNQTEKVDFEWVDGEALFNLICGNSDLKTKMVSPESGLLQWRENEELHPFFLTLFRGAKTLIKPLVQEENQQRQVVRPNATNAPGAVVGKEVARKKKGRESKK
jgi:hypothetical protein